MSNRYSHIVFDLDGTLMDTSPGVIRSFTAVEDKLGLRHITPPEQRSVIGPPLEDSLLRLYGLEGEDNQHALDVFNVIYATPEGAGDSPLYPGVLDTLKKLKERGVRISIATMKPWIFTSICLETKGILDLFDSVVCYEDNSGFTKAQLVLRALEQAGGKPENALMVGDSSIDGRGAAEAGLDFAAVTGGFGFAGEEDLAEIPHVACAELIPGLWEFLDAHI